jgi:hypothetical protein
MAYILSAQRDQDNMQEARRLWNAYEQYLKSNEAKFPQGAYRLATSDWYFGFEDHRAPHDAWLQEVRFEEPAKGERSEIRSTCLRIRLLGAYHDLWLEFFYPQVYSYTLSGPAVCRGHGDWRYDEFRLSEAGHLLHEIEWAGYPSEEGSRWIIEASDVEFTCEPRV